MSESFSVCNAASGSQQASTENPRVFSSRNRRGVLFLRPRPSLFARRPLKTSPPRVRGRPSCWEQASIRKEVGLDKSGWGQMEK